MNRKEWILIGFVLVLVGAYAVFFTNWFGPKNIRIEHSARSLRDAYGERGRPASTDRQSRLGNVTFAFHKDYRLTSVVVVDAAEAATNEYAHALWHLVSKNGSDPVDGLCYGMPVPGMLSEQVEAEPLVPGRNYRLMVRAKAWSGEHDFAVPIQTRRQR